MVIARILAGTKAVPGRGSSFVVALVAALLVQSAPLSAQEVGADPVKPAATPPSATPQGSEPKAAPVYGRVLVDAVKLRCWPSTVAEPPVFEDTMPKDQIVQLGRSENGFRAVLTPLGPLGYVSRKFTASSADGHVASKGTKVAFRYRPRSSEAPVAQLADGTELHVVGEQDDWYRVRVEGIEAWLAEAEVQVVDANDPAVAAGIAALRAQEEGEIKARLDTIAQQQKREQQDQADLAAVKMVEDAFAAQLQKPIGEQVLAPLNETLDKLSATLAPESAGVAAVAALKKRIETQTWIAEATAVRDSKPPLPDAPPPEKKDELERFQSIGWLRYESRLAGPGVFYMEKGGQRLYVVSCNTGRYDLSLFIDREIGVTGPRRHPATESLSVLDVERLEVLGSVNR